MVFKALNDLLLRYEASRPLRWSGISSGIRSAYCPCSQNYTWRSSIQFLCTTYLNIPDHDTHTPDRDTRTWPRHTYLTTTHTPDRDTHTPDHDTHTPDHDTHTWPRHTYLTTTHTHLTTTHVPDHDTHTWPRHTHTYLILYRETFSCLMDRVNSSKAPSHFEVILDWTSADPEKERKKTGWKNWYQTPFKKVPFLNVDDQQTHKAQDWSTDSSEFGNKQQLRG